MKEPNLLPKVLIIDNSKYVTGALKSMVLFSTVLSADYCFVWAVSNELKKDEFEGLAGTPFHFSFRFLEISKNFSSILLYLPFLCFNTFRFYRLTEKEKIGIVHVNDLYNMTGVFLKVISPKLKLVYHIRLLPTSYIGPLYSFFLFFIKRKADMIICNSHAVSKAVGLSAKKKVIYNGEAFIPGHKQLEVRRVVKKVVYIGNIVPGKGQDLAIDAFSKVAAKFKGIKLLFVGKYDHNPASKAFKKLLESKILERGLSEQIVFAGFVSDIPAAISEGDIVLNLSESESFSRVCLEALAVGVPLIAADSGGPAEIFEHMKSGWLVPNRNPQAAAEALEALIDDYNLRRDFAFFGRQYVKAKFDIESNALQLKNVYQTLTGTF